jgi:hypothetical protein
MKTKINWNKKQEVERTIIAIILDRETWAEGIPQIDRELQEKGFTTKELNAIYSGIYRTIKRLQKKI